MEKLLILNKNMSPLYLLTYLPSLFPTDLYFDPLIDVSSHVKTAFEYKQV